MMGNPDFYYANPPPVNPDAEDVGVASNETVASENVDDYYLVNDENDNKDDDYLNNDVGGADDDYLDNDGGDNNPENITGKLADVDINDESVVNEGIDDKVDADDDYLESSDVGNEDVGGDDAEGGGDGGGAEVVDEDTGEAADEGVSQSISKGKFIMKQVEPRCL